MHFGLGPVFIYECLASSRCWPTYALRVAGVAALLFSMWTIATSRATPVAASSWRDYAALGTPSRPAQGDILRPRSRGHSNRFPRAAVRRSR